MDPSTLDAILLVQLTVARLGEREALNWWNTDIAFKHGGADFLNRLVGPAFAPLAAGEGLLLAARLREEPLLAAVKSDTAFSLFCPAPATRLALAERYRHLKNYPDDLPPSLRDILDPELDLKPDDALARLYVSEKPRVQGTALGRLVLGLENAAPLQIARSLAATLTAADRGRFVLAYYQESHAV